MKRWPWLFALTGALSFFAVTTTNWIGGTFGESFTAAIGSNGQPVHWSRGPSEVLFPTLWWRPVRLAMMLRTPDDVPGESAQIVLSIDNVPIRQLTITREWSRHVVTAPGGGGGTHGLRLQIEDGSPDDSGVGVGAVIIRPAGISRRALLLVLLGAALGWAVWLVLPAARPFRARAGVRGRAIWAKLDAHPSWIAWRDRPNVWVIAGLTAIPVVHVVGLVWVYSVDVPFGDSWELVPMLAASYDGTLRWSDLWSLHNEHRVIFPRLIMIGLARLSDWNARWETITSTLLAVGTLWVLIQMIRRTGRGQSTVSVWVIPVAAALLFSAKQWENWLWGWQLLMFLNILAVVGMVLVLTRERLEAKHLGGGVALAVIASYSFASGLVSWGVGLAALSVPRTRFRPRFVAAWLVSALVVVVLYEQAGERPLVGASPVTALLSTANTSQMALYLTKYFGAPLVGRTGVAVAVGFLGLALFGGLVIQALRRQDSSQHLTFLVLGLYPLGTGLLTAIARSDLGSDQAMSSRYITMSAFLWIAIVAHLSQRTESSIPGRTLLGRICVVTMIGLVALRASFLATPAFERYHNRLTEAREALIDGEGAAVMFLYPDSTLLERRRTTLEALELSVFRKSRTESRNDE